MRVGIIGSGDVGQALGIGFASRGHEVKLGTRDPSTDKIRAWIERVGPRASAGTFADAAAFAELAVLATAWNGTESAIRLAGPQNLAGKVVIDATNPLAFERGGPPTLAVGWRDSGGEQVQRWLPESRVVKAFNTIGNAHMVSPQFPGGPPDMFIAGNDESAKKKVTEILDSFGWNGAIDLGGIENARYLEPLAMVWIAYFFRTGTGNHALKMLRK